MKKDELCMRGAYNIPAENTLAKLCSDNGPDTTSSLPLEIPKLYAVLDWLSFTFDTQYYDIEDAFYCLYTFLDLPKREEWTENQYKEKGYASSISYGNICIFYNSYGVSINESGEKGIKVQFSGQGCRQAELFFKNNLTWRDLFRYILDLDLNVTRMDIAIDDHRGAFTVRDLLDIANNGLMAAKTKKWKEDGYKDNNGQTLGESMYIGSNKSRIMFRIYDKAKQLKIDKHDWLRFEVQLREERAQILMEQLIMYPNKHIGYFVGGIIKYYLNFKHVPEGSKETNKSRLPSVPFWIDFLEGITPLQLTRQLPDESIERKHAWIEKQVSKSLALLFFAYQDEEDKEQWLTKLAYEGYKKLNDKDLKILQEYKKRKAYQKRQTSQNLLIL